MPNNEQPPVGVEAQLASRILEPDYAVKGNGGAKKVAVVVYHGVGQQVPFETLELVAKALWKKEQATHGNGPPIVTRVVRLGTEGKPAEMQLPRAEVHLTGQKGDSLEAHLYEAYWAPLTEGKVSLRQVIWFLLDAGWSGISNSGPGSFKRWMFHGWQEIKLRTTQLVLSFFIAVLAVLALVVINTMIVTAAASHALGSSGAWPPAGAVGLFTRDLFWIDLSASGIFLGTYAIPKMVRALRILKKPLLYLAWILTFAGMAGLIGTGILAFFQIALRHEYPVSEVFSNRYVVAALWAIAICASAVVRKIIVEYVGDVTAYVAYHTVSVFLEVRQAIYNLGISVARAVYRARTDDDRDFVYDRVVVVGHSLGSVIAYDVLNGLFIEDGFSKQPLDISGRTSLFLTFGSPLDKTAFIFRTQQDAESSLREADATAVQPMIQSYDFRPQRWTNLWSHSDWISGSLEYYDDWNDPNAGDRQRVVNLRDRDAIAPLVAHTQYWHNDLFADVLYAAVTESPLPTPQRITSWRRRFAWLFAEPVNPVVSAYRPQ